MQQVKGDGFLALTSISLILGVILTLAANAIFPRTTDPNSLLSNITSFADNEVPGQLASLGTTIGTWGIVAGVVSIYCSVE